ncbi:MAG: acyltransferase 3 [Verrucomicrobia bacterium]|nr:acyltransferase 3 [Verrucomicrobiota bacterium]
MASTMKRVQGLDGVRGFAILWVLAYHLYALLPKAGWAAIPGLQGFSALGWIGVSLFFSLSGYLIVPMLVAQKGAPHFFGRFWGRRAFRLLPVYILVLLSFVIAGACWPEGAPGRERLFGPGIPLWSYAALVQNVLMASHAFLGTEWLRVTWSLAVEVQFYALICVLVYFLPRAQLVRWLVALALGAVLVRFAVVFVNPGANAPLVVLLPCRLDAFLLGALAAMLPAVTEQRRRPRQFAAVAVLAASAAAFGFFVSGGFGAAYRFVLPTYYLMLATGSAALIELSAMSSPLVRWLMESRAMVRAGRLSYFLYLFHFPVVWTIYAGVFKLEPNLETPRALAVMGLVIGVLWLLAELSYRFVEAPLIRRAHRF